MEALFTGSPASLIYSDAVNTAGLRYAHLILSFYTFRKLLPQLRCPAAPGDHEQGGTKIHRKFCKFCQLTRRNIAEDLNINQLAVRSSHLVLPDTFIYHFYFISSTT